MLISELVDKEKTAFETIDTGRLMHIEVNSQCRIFPIQHIDMNTVTVEVDAHIQRYLTSDTLYNSVTLSFNGQAFDDLSFSIRDSLNDTDSKQQVVFQASNPRTSHALWSIADLEQVPGDHDNPTTLSHIPGRGEYTEQAKSQRINFIEEQLNQSITDIANTTIAAEAVEGNIENFVGSIEVPVAVVGPLKIDGKHAKGTYHAPLATTEGALISSVTRGAIALSRSGGVSTSTIWQRMNRAPVFNLSTLKDALFLSEWIQENRENIHRVIAEHSRFAMLVDLDCRIVGNNLHVKFSYETADASGQNMTTKCTWEACQWVLQAFSRSYPGFIRGFMIDGNMSSDKKVSFGSFINGRGTKVVAEATINEKVLRSVLKVKPDQIIKSYHDIALGANQSGMIGMTINTSNVIGAIFTATGQDIACVHESSLGQMYLERTQDGIYASMTLTNLVVGTVGGGTGLPQQRKGLEMIDCYGKNRANRFAEIICAYCLALDLSTLSAVSGGQFVHAHENLGRNRPKAKQ